MKLQAEMPKFTTWLKDNEEIIRRYAEDLLINDKEWKDYNIRLSCDLVRACFKTSGLCSFYDKYNCHDSHITTLALAGVKAVYPELLNGIKR